MINLANATEGEVRTEFERFAAWVSSAQAKLRAATDEMDKVGTRTNQLSRRLKRVDAIEHPAKAMALPESLPRNSSRSPWIRTWSSAWPWPGRTPG